MCKESRFIQIVQEYNLNQNKSQVEKETVVNLSSFLERAVKSQCYKSDYSFSHYGIWAKEVSKKVHEIIKKAQNDARFEIIESLSEVVNSLDSFSKVQQVMDDDYRNNILNKTIFTMEEYYLNADMTIELTKDANEIIIHAEKLRMYDNFYEVIDYNVEVYLDIMIDLLMMIENEPMEYKNIRRKIIEKYDLAKFLLAELDGDYGWVDGNSIYVATSNGLLEPSVHVPMFDGPYLITQKEYKKIEKSISENNDLDDYDPKIVQMVQSDSKPDTCYYTWSSDVEIDDEFYDFDQMIEKCMELWTEEGEPTPWENFNDEYCLEWCERIDFLKSKNLSWYDPSR